MLGILFFSALVTLLSFLEYRRRNGPWETSLARTFSLRSTKPLRKKHDSITAPLEQDITTGNERSDDSLPRIETASRVHIKRVNFHEEAPQMQKAKLSLEPPRSKPTSSRVAERFPMLHFKETPSKPGKPLQGPLSDPLSVEQKALPTFSFNQLPTTVGGPSRNLDTSMKPPPASKTKPHIDFGRPAPFQSSSWNHGFAVRNGNAKKANRDAMINSHSELIEQSRNISHGVGRRGERNRGPTRTMRKAVARFGQQLAKLDNSGDEMDVDVNQTLESQSGMSHPDSIPAISPTIPMETDAGNPVILATQALGTSTFQQTRERSSLRRRFNNLGEKFGLHKEAYTGLYTALQEHSNGNQDPSLTHSHASPSNAKLAGEYFGSKGKSSSWKSGWSLSGRKRVHETIPFRHSMGEG